MRGIAENMYIGYEPYIVDHSAYAEAFGDHATPLPEAIRATVQWYRAHAAQAQHAPAACTHRYGACDRAQRISEREIIRGFRSDCRIKPEQSRSMMMRSHRGRMLRGGSGPAGGWRLSGFRLGGLAATALVGGVTTPVEGVLGGVATGAVIGLAQWLVLRRRLALTPWWIAATAAGMGVGLALGIALLGADTAGITLPLRGLVTGAGIGIAQFTLLRGSTARALVWPLVVACGWAIGWLVTRAAGVDLAPQWSVFGAAGALTFQLLTGLALAWLLPPATLMLDR